MKFAGLLICILIAAAPSGPASEIQHGFLATGSHTYLMDGSGQQIWTYPHATRDGYVLQDGRIVLTLNKGNRFPGGAVVIVDREAKTEVLVWKGTQSEVNSAQPTPEGTLVITEAGPDPRLLEVRYPDPPAADSDTSATDKNSAVGEIVLQFPLQCQPADHHMQTRMARKLADGTYLAPHLLDFAVKHYDRSGAVIGQLDTAVAGDTQRSIHTWPFTAIRTDNGHTLVCCTNGNRVVEFDSTGKIVWQLTNADLPGPWLQDPCGGQVLANGNIVITSYAAGRSDPAAPKLIEVDRQKNVVWTYSDGHRHGIHHFQILTSDGRALPDFPLK